MNPQQIGQRIAEWIEIHGLFNKKDSIVLGISGGKDSVALARILKELGYNISLAHMNFQLRGKDSDADEAFVVSLAAQLEVPLHIKRVDTPSLALAGESTQMAARRLRYNWFEELCASEGYTSIATAHSANDNAETLLFNLAQGTGMKGLVGIPVSNGKVKRPMLCLSSAEVLQYLKYTDQAHREDISNSSDYYKRNYIRHHVVPALKQINPQLVPNLTSHSERFRHISGYYHRKLREDLLQYWQTTPIGNWTLHLTPFLKNPDAEHLWVEWLRPLKFSPPSLLSFLRSQTGAQLSNAPKTHLLVKERNSIGLIKLEEGIVAPVRLDVRENGALEHAWGDLRWERLSNLDGQNLKAPESAFLNLEKIPTDSLTLEPVCEGDRFKPFGMKGSQLISDYCTNRKLSFESKQQLLVIKDQSAIAWLVHERSSDLYKVGPESTQILKLTWSKKTKSPFPFPENI